MRTVIYARKSTESDDRQVQSLDDQLKAMREIARREGFAVVETFIESRSAKAPGTRPEFQRMVSMVQDGKAEIILTWAADRLSRNPVDGGMVAYLLQTGKLSLIRTHDRSYRPEDTSLLLAIENAMATDYVRKLKNDVSRGMLGKVERGWHACKAPVGYMNDAETRQILPDPQRFDPLREAWELLLSGRHSVAEIHRFMVAKGLTVRVRRNCSMSPISAAKLYQVFRSRFYAGEVVYKGKGYPGKHRAMVTQEEFNDAQLLLNRAGKTKKPEGKRFPFAGVLRCAVCGCAIVGEQKKKRYPRSGRVAVYTYYHCSGSKGCPKTGVREECLVERAEGIVSHLRMTRGTAAWLLDAVAKSFEREAVDTAEGIGGLAKKAAAEDARLRRLSELRLDGEFDGAEYAELRRGILERQAELREKIHHARDLAGRVVRLISKKLDACIAAGELRDINHDPGILARILRIGGTSLLNLSDVEFRLDPILAKIAAFELLRDSSEKPKDSDLLPLNSVWWTFAEELRNLATGEVDRIEATNRARTYQDLRWDRTYGHDL